jgi:hypothetical protein
MSGLDAPAPTLPVSCVLDGHSIRGELVAQSVGCREVAGGPRRGALVEEGRDLGFEVLGFVGEDRQDPVEVAQGRERAAGILGRQ